MLNAKAIREAAEADFEFINAARFWNAVIAIDTGPERYVLEMKDGRIARFELDRSGGSRHDLLITAPSESWAQGRDHPLKVYGPPGVEQVVNGFAQAYALDEGYRIAHHGAALMPADNWQMQPVSIAMPVIALPGTEMRRSVATVLEEEGLKVTAFTVDHAPVVPAYGYRFDYKGRSVVISGDTRPCANLVENSRDADVLVSEAQSAEMVKMIEAEVRAQGNERAAKIMHDILRYHTTPAEAATEANEAGARMLVLSHIGPPTPNAIARMIFMRGVSAIRPHGVVLGYDGMLLTMPAGSTAIDISSIE